MSPEESGHDHPAPGQSEVFHDTQIAALDKLRGRGRHGAEVEGKWSETKLRVDATKGAEGQLRAEIGRIMNHPCESDWWVEHVKAWFNASTELLVTYIDERNTGVRTTRDTEPTAMVKT
jgi:hypothetical protein